MKVTWFLWSSISPALLGLPQCWRDQPQTCLASLHFSVCSMSCYYGYHTALCSQCLSGDEPVNGPYIFICLKQLWLTSVLMDSSGTGSIGCRETRRLRPPVTCPARVIRVWWAGNIDLQESCWWEGQEYGGGANEERGGANTFSSSQTSYAHPRVANSGDPPAGTEVSLKILESSLVQSGLVWFGLGQSVSVWVSLV